MLKLISLSLKNFMSVGNVTQSIKFDQYDLVLVLGENLDLGGNDSRNGVGKSTIVNALSYALYGKPLVNVKLENLLNKTNLKHMLVILEFENDGIKYKIERGRKPGIFKFIKDNVDLNKDDNDAQGENRHTQESIERLINISHDMFKHILALNTYVEPFLSLRSSDQRVIIEQLLGITKLSEKADKLKLEISTVKNEIKEQEYQIQAINEANKRIHASIEGLASKSASWETEKQKKIDSYHSKVLRLMELDIDSEIASHKSIKEINELTAEYKSLSKDLTLVERDIRAHTQQVLTAQNNLAITKDHICPLCNQDMDTDTHDEVHSGFQTQINEALSKLEDKETKKLEISTLIAAIKPNIPELPVTFYSTVEEAYNHKTILDTAANSLEKELESKNPYTEHIESLRSDSLQVVDFTKMNELVNLRDHMEFLLKLLTNKDSFIRKKIIDQNLTYLNFRLASYLEKIGLPHTVKFKSDLEVEIALYGKEFDFDNLSRGERTRLILSLSWAFRDVYESLYNKINLLFIDELIDSGLDASGVEGALVILKKMARESQRNIYLISHRDELIGRVTNVLKVIKEGGFTSLEMGDTQI